MKNFKIFFTEGNEQTASKAINILKNKLVLTDVNFKKISSNRYKILVPASDRIHYFKQISDISGFEPVQISGSSLGGLSYKGEISFLIKPLQSQGRASSGMNNEDLLINKINEYIGLGIKNIHFSGKNKSFKISDVKGVSAVGYDVRGGKKADVIITAKGGSFPLSIKMDNAQIWESADTRYAKEVDALFRKIKNGGFAPRLVFKPFKTKTGSIKKGIYTMYDEIGDRKIAGVIITDLPSVDTKSIIFGSDKCRVIYKTFTDDDFVVQRKTLYIQTTKIIENIKDVSMFNLEPVLNIRHDSTRANTGGLRAIVQPKSAIYKNYQLAGNRIEIKHSELFS